MRLLLLLVALIAAVVALVTRGTTSASLLMLAFVMAAFVGFVEILVRFRDEPFQAVSSTPGVAYWFINGVAGGGIYLLIHYLDINFGAAADSPLKHVMQVTIASFSGIAFLRSGFFVGKDKESGENLMYGPALVLENILAVVSTQVDRERALRRILFAETASANLTLVQAHAMLGVLTASVQTMAAEQATGISSLAGSIVANASLEEKIKVRMLLLLYLTHFGEKAVNVAKPKP